MTKRIELNWKVDGSIDEQRYYCSETAINTENLPAPKAVLSSSARSYIDTDIEEGKTYYISVGSVKDGVEKLGDIIEVKTIMNPISLSPSVYFDASDLSFGGINSWTCRVTGASVTGSAVATEDLGFKTCSFSANSVLSSSDAAFSSLMSNKTQGSVFLVFKKDIVDTTSQSRRLFNLATPAGTARFAVYADDRVAGNMNKLVVGGRRLDSNAYKSLATQNTVDLNTHMLFACVDHTTAKFSLSLDGDDLIYSDTAQGVGVTSATSGSFILGGGAAGSGFVGHLACVIFFDRTLTVAERQSLEDWAAQEYGLTDNLPVGHRARH